MIHWNSRMVWGRIILACEHILEISSYPSSLKIELLPLFLLFLQMYLLRIVPLVPVLNPKSNKGGHLVAAM